MKTINVGDSNIYFRNQHEKLVRKVYLKNIVKAIDKQCALYKTVSTQGDHSCFTLPIPGVKR